MKLYIYIPLILLSVILFTSCKKKKKKEETDFPAYVEISGKRYETATIGNQIWTTSNHDGPGGIPFDQANSKPEYGRYYTMEEVRAVVLPNGWRIPSQEDYKKLAESQGAAFSSNLTVLNPEVLKRLTSKSRWKNVPGNNESGFNGYPGGYSFRESAPVDGDICEFWADDESSVSIQETANQALRMVFYAKGPDNRFNVRFVRDK